jgi:putative heme-binding domain-containing protein
MTYRTLQFAVTALFLALATNHGLRGAEDSAASSFSLRPGDHISLIGNTLAERMQQNGWLETLLHSRFPEHNLVIRNLGFSGDELTLRLRSQDFGTPDDWLARTRADVVFAFFGYNESFGGPAGLKRFEQDLDGFIKHTLGQEYNGKRPPRLVLFSPIANENLHDRNLPDGRDTNMRLQIYTEAIARAARANQVVFVDLFHSTQKLYEARTPHQTRLTINGIHLREHGNWLVARAIDRALFPGTSKQPADKGSLAKLRQAVLDKNFCWFKRYRTVDGYSIYGGRADLAFVDGQTNRAVMQREMEILDVMTANRDRRIWAVARGGDLKVDDSNTPRFIPVKTNKPGPGPGGSHIFLDGEGATRAMSLARGLRINLFASEKEFPDLAKPVQMAFDTRGRLWVAVWPSYPHWKPKEELNDKLLILEDTDGDGKADKCTVFADHLHCPTGFAFYNGGVLVAQAPGLLYLKDTDSDDRADVREQVLGGLDSADTHHTANSFALDPGGAVYFQEGTFHHTQVETPYGPPVRCANAGVYRYEPRTQKFEVYVTYPFANPHGHVFDSWGQDIIMDGTGANPYHGALFSGHLEFPEKHRQPPQVYKQWTRPCPGVEILSSRHFPESYQGNLLVGNVIGFQGILQYRLRSNGSSLAGTQVEPIVSSTDANFRPSDIKIGPDGAIYFLDWQNPIIGHMQHNLRDPSRDRKHGRVYRITHEDRPLLTPVKIAGEPVERLLELLKEPEDRVRERARIELGARDTGEVIAKLKNWLDALTASDLNREHHRLEALWLYQSHNIANEALLKRVLESPSFRARAAATRVLCYWRDRLPGALELLKKLAADPHPAVRLEAVRAASFFTVPEAVEVAAISAQQDSDAPLEYVRQETLRALEPYWKKALAEGREVAFTTQAARRYFLTRVGTEDLLKIKRNRSIYQELLLRRGVRDEFRREAAAELAKLDRQSQVQILLEAALSQDGQRAQGPAAAGMDESVAFDLTRLLTSQPAAELARARATLVKLATEAKAPVTRQLGYLALIAADGDATPAWELGVRSETGLADLLSAVPFIGDAGQKASLYPKIETLLGDSPSLAAPHSKEDLRRAAMTALTSVRGQEEASFKTLARIAGGEADRPAALQALLRLPSSSWPAAEASPLLQTLLSYLRKLPPRERTTPTAVDALQLCDGLAALLPLPEAKKIRRELGELGVRVLRLGTVPEQMLFDNERLVVQSGKPVELLFENTDLMPHNFVLTQPGALEEIGQLAESSATQPGALERHYVPASTKILLSSRLLAPRAAEKLAFTAPAQPGIYPYVCTYPGHWRRMYGALYVVGDLDSYLAEPESYLARRPLTAVDPLLRFTRPRKEWKFADLAESVEQMGHGRSFTGGKQLFQIANCVACHRLNGAGQETGPDLAKLDPKLKPADILRDIIEPSYRINEKFYSYVFETQSGKLVTGLVVEETPGLVKVSENPLTKTAPVVLKKSEIVERKKSTISIMPKGLLDKLSREEILDLVAYVVAGGKPDHPLFQGEHHH